MCSSEVAKLLAESRLRVEWSKRADCNIVVGIQGRSSDVEERMKSSVEASRCICFYRLIRKDILILKFRYCIRRLISSGVVRMLSSSTSTRAPGSFMQSSRGEAVTLATSWSSRSPADHFPQSDSAFQRQSSSMADRSRKCFYSD